MKKTVIVDIVIVNSVMGLKGWGRGEGVQNQEVGQLLPGKTRVDGDSPP
jgi:hypothetical protein